MSDQSIMADQSITSENAATSFGTVDYVVVVIVLLISSAIGKSILLILYLSFIIFEN